MFRVVDQKGMREKARDELKELGISTLQDVTVPVENLSGGSAKPSRWRAPRRSARRSSCSTSRPRPGRARVEPGARADQNLRDRGIPVILISHNMPHVFEVADRIHIQRLGKRAATITPESHSMTDAVAIMTGAARA